MNDIPFNNESTQAERRQVELDTYLARAQADTDLAAGGRFKNQNPTEVVGVPQYPAQPANSPWHHDPVLPEEPLGIDVNKMEP